MNDGNDASGKTKYKDAHTSAFRGTSAASAMIAGAALVVQGMNRAATKTHLSPMEMRALLVDRTPGRNTPILKPATGSNPAMDVYDFIGVLPNLKKIAEQLGVLTVE